MRNMGLTFLCLVWYNYQLRDASGKVSPICLHPCINIGLSDLNELLSENFKLRNRW